jgi:hypothetical protein
MLTGCSDGTAPWSRASHTPACDECRITRTFTAWIDDDTAALTATAPVGDSLIVADSYAGLIRILSPDRTQTDSVSLPGGVRIRALSVLRWPERLAFSGIALGRSDLFRATVRDGFLVIDTSFRPPDVMAAVRAPDYRLFQRGETLWAVEAGSYTILQFDSAGALVSRVVRSPRWFAKPGGRPSGGHRSTVRAVSVDERGRLWVYSTQPTDSARVAWRSREARRAGGTVQADAEDLYETIIEVLDADARTLIAHGRIAAEVAGVTPDGQALIRQRSDDGSMALSVQQLQLRDPGSGR